MAALLARAQLLLAAAGAARAGCVERAAPFLSEVS
jgi:hypothetical protein